MSDNRRPLEPLAVDAATLARMLCVSVRTVRMLDAAGKLPKPVTIGARSKRWSVLDIEIWIALGCPNRAMFDAIKTEVPKLKPDAMRTVAEWQYRER